MSPDERLVLRVTVLTVVALVALRPCAALTPLTFDEAYYWTWSKHLAGVYYDHPPMVAIVIRPGTMIAGDTEFGVRLISVLLVLPMSFAVYRATVLLFANPRAAAMATIFLNVMLMVAAGTVILTPDAPLMVASSFVLLCLAKVIVTERGTWWLAVGAAVGLALVSKYTALFFGPAILIWLLAVPELRRADIAGAVFTRPDLERRPSLGVFRKAVRTRARPRVHVALSCRAPSDAGGFPHAAGVCPRRHGPVRMVDARRWHARGQISSRASCCTLTTGIRMISRRRDTQAQVTYD